MALETMGAMATVRENDRYVSYIVENEVSDEDIDRYRESMDEKYKMLGAYGKKLGNAEFDARAFNVPEWDCINNIIWRQQDAIRNSVEMVGHCYFSAKELNKVNVEDIKSKLKSEKGIDWEKDFTDYQKRGACCYKQSEYRVTRTNEKVIRNFWYINEMMPVVQNNREWFSEITGLVE